MNVYEGYLPNQILVNIGVHLVQFIHLIIKLSLWLITYHLENILYTCSKKVSNIQCNLYRSMPARRKRRTIPTRSELVIYHDVVLGGNSMSKSTASLSKAWSTFSTGGSSLTIGGSTATFAKLVLMLEGGTTNSKTEFVFVVCSRN